LAWPDEPVSAFPDRLPAPNRPLGSDGGGPGCQRWWRWQLTVLLVSAVDPARQQRRAVGDEQAENRAGVREAVAAHWLAQAPSPGSGAFLDLVFGIRTSWRNRAGTLDPAPRLLQNPARLEAHWKAAPTSQPPTGLLLRLTCGWATFTAN